MFWEIFYYHVSSKQNMEGGIQLRILSKERPHIECRQTDVTLEDAYMYLTKNENQ